MLRRRSIRTKLIGALALLSVIVLLLAGSGFWGLYDNQRTANDIIDRSAELLHASQLNAKAIELQKSNDRIIDLLNEEGMIESSLSPSHSKINLECTSFVVLLDTISLELDTISLEMDKYPGPGQEYPGPGQELTSTDSQPPATVFKRPSFIAIRDSVAKIASFHGAQSLVLSNRRQLSHHIDQLVVETDDHIEVVNNDIEDLSETLEANYRTWTTLAWGCAALALAFVGMLLWALNSLVVKPFRTLLDGSRLVAGGQFDHRIDLGTGDELSELAVAMNDMTDRFQGALNKVNSWCTDLDMQVRERTREVIQNEQLASVGFLAAGVAHEINNPLATIAWSAESLESRVREITQLPDGQRNVDEDLSHCLSENLRRIEEEAYRCKGITEKLLDFSRLSEVRRAPTNLIDLVNDVVQMVGKVGKFRCKTMQVHGDEKVTAHVNPQEIRQVVLNLVTNALESVDTDGAVHIHVHSDGQTASVVIEDNGCGMTEEVLEHLFEPFFTRRRDGTGTGLGLSITYRIVSQHGGSLSAQSDGENCGSRVEMLLPVQPDYDDNTPSRHTLGLTHEPIKAA
ncbi:MAG: HAMP domain-containing histidine kinase [Pirellulales bacterium]|nr:HAMP domain-containing histidine kinase [Pirellulales bacterium]